MSTYIISIIPDEDVENPRIFYPNLGTLVTWHPRYTLGGNDDLNTNYIDNIYQWILENIIPASEIPKKYLTFDEVVDDPSFEKFVKNWCTKNLVLLPVYLYDHSGLTISTHPFSCPWDSGQVGFIYVTKQQAAQQQIKFEDCDKILQQEVAELDSFLRGDVYYYRTVKLLESTERSEEDINDLIEQYNLKLVKETKDGPVFLTQHSTWDLEEVEELDSCGGCYDFDYTLQSALQLVS